MKKNLSYYLSLKYPFVIKEDEENGKKYFDVEIPDLSGCGAHGKTVEEASKNLDKAKRLWIEVSLKKGNPIPEPASEDEFSGRFLLRIPAKLHMKLSLNAKQECISLNQYIRKNLETDISQDSILEKINELSKKVEKIDKLSQRVEQLSEAISEVSEAGYIKWTTEQPSEPSYRSIYTSADQSHIRSALITSSCLGIYSTADLYNWGYASHIGTVAFSTSECLKKETKIDSLKTLIAKED